jgi:23S rRNA maturation mini-RNase III
MTDIKQFIMANGDEIICEVLEWASEVDPDMVVRKAFKVVQIDDPIRGIRYFTLRPWMLYQIGDEIFNTINTNHIVSEGNPSPQLFHQYQTAIRETEKQDEEFEERVTAMAEKLEGMMEENINKDSSQDNIVYLGKFDKGKLH